jgi:hypothetical protein
MDQFAPGSQPMLRGHRQTSQKISSALAEWHVTAFRDLLPDLGLVHFLPCLPTPQQEDEHTGHKDKDAVEDERPVHVEWRRCVGPSSESALGCVISQGQDLG